MSKSQFNTTKLTNHRVLIEGPKGQHYIADGSQLVDIDAYLDAKDAEEQFNSEAEAFFAPLLDAADKVEAAFKARSDARDAYTEKVIFTEGRPAIPAVEEDSVELTHDSQILIRLRRGDDSQLRWAGKDQILIVADEEEGMTAEYPA